MVSEHFTNMIASAEIEINAGNITLIPGSLLEALVEGRYLYVYLDTSDNFSTTLAEGDNILSMGRTDSKRYLSFYYDFFLLLRGGATTPEGQRQA